jgi:hypothetical protein
MNRHSAKDNRKKYFEGIGIDSHRIVTADSVHGVVVANVGDENAGAMIAGTDALITDTKNLFLSATAADCLLLYFFDPVTQSIGITHAGWRGVCGGIAKNTVLAFLSQYGVDACNLLVGVAPSIRECHFEISATDKEKFQEFPQFIFERDGKVFVGLQGIVQEQLQGLGILKENIEDSGICTHCNEKDYFSYRRDKPKDVQVMVGYIGMRRKL